MLRLELEGRVDGVQGGFVFHFGSPCQVVVNAEKYGIFHIATIVPTQNWAENTCFQPFGRSNFRQLVK